MGSCGRGNTVQCGPCANCGEKPGSFCSSSWGHSFVCCSNECGIELAGKLRYIEDGDEYLVIQRKIHNLEAELHDLVWGMVHPRAVEAGIKGAWIGMRGMSDCEKCDGPAPSNSVCAACEESRYGRAVRDAFETMGNPVPRTTVNLPCRRCGNTKREQTNPGMCVLWCAAIVVPDPAREAQTDRRIHDMRQIHEIEMSMTDMQRREWVMHGRYILDRDRGESVGFGLGEK